MNSSDVAQAIVNCIRSRVDNHIYDGMSQWYVSEFSIDCEAEEFWRVVEGAVREVCDATPSPLGAVPPLADEQYDELVAKWTAAYGSGAPGRIQS